jgi:superfamily I DNA/RNA helicase
MINKYPGTCSCGIPVPAGAGEARKVDGRWTVVCPACLTEPPQAEYDDGVSDTVTEAVARAEQCADITSEYTLLSGHPASPYQAAVFDHFRYGRGSVIVMAGAGSGKTTTMKNALRYLSTRLHVQLFAFGHDAAAQLKAAVAELAALGEKSYANVRAGSFHSVCYGAVRRHLNLPENQIRVDAGKCARILKDRLCVDDAGVATWRLYADFAIKLVNLAKGEGIGALVPDTEERWWALVDHHGLYLDSLDAEPAAGIALARRLLGWSNDAARQGWIDFDDQIYLVVLWKLRLWRNDVVIVDEAQDTNPVRRAVLHLTLKDGGRLYAVGDETQSIMGFTGASVDAMARIAAEFNCRELPLTVSYRCAKTIVDRARTWMPRLEPAPGAAEGEVLDEVPLHAALAQLTPRDAILCRQTAPLVGLAYGLIARGRPCRVLGKEIGEGLVNLIEQQRAKGLDRLVAKLEAWRDRETAKFVAKGEEGRAEAVADRVNCVLVIVEALPETERTVPALVRRISSMFEDARKDEVQTLLTLATQHKSKGREWPQVAILRPDLNPSKAARLEWQETQEFNLMGVAATRARERLIYVRGEDAEIDPPAAK